MSIWFRIGQFIPAIFMIVISCVARGDDSLPDHVDFNRDIRPILSDVCFHCHGPDQTKRQGHLRLDTEEGAFADLDHGRHAIVARRPESSELVRRINSTDADLQMPPPDAERRLSVRQIALLTRWIEQGAKWEVHWSFVKPVRADLPSLKTVGWARSPIDIFVLTKLDLEGLQPSSEADRTTLLRRVTLDLIGLPPTQDEVADFLADDSADAFERVVDRLLASPRYGERMAIRWLNGARYADTSGYQSDGERAMWRWRDWVIEAYNENMPFDRFTIEQLAGDLSPNPTLDQKIATGFNRNHRGNAEGGIIPEEFAVEYVVDRVETTGTVWLGLTVMCARCHSHKYDPITQTDFYQLFSFFNNIPEKGRAVKFGNSPPYVVSPTRDQEFELSRLKSRLANAESKWASLERQLASSQAAWESNQIPDRLSTDTVRRNLILHFPLDGNATAAVATPAAFDRAKSFLGQIRLLTPPSNSGDVPPENGNPRFSSGRFGQALDCDGQHYAAVGDVANFGFFNKFSISAWIQAKGERGGTIVSRMKDEPHGEGWGITLDQGKLQVHLTKRWLDDACRVETAETIAADHWYHVVVTYDGSRETSGIRIYINGLAQQTVSLLDELNQSFDNKSPLRIGGGNGPGGRFHGLIDDVRIFNQVLQHEDCQILAQTDSLSEIVAIPTEKRSKTQAATLRNYYLLAVPNEPIRSAWEQLVALRDEWSNYIEDLPTTMVMQELPTQRETFVLHRGEYDKRGERVTPGVPSSLSRWPDHAPRNRLGLAQWLVDDRHPLTARVAVNRLWQMLFGLGLVKTVDDFGTQGEWPSHPELLDWLAVEFRDGSPANTQGGVNDSENKSTHQERHASKNSWDTKRILRLVITSATYRQSSQTSALLQQRDPENRWLARGPRFRLSAEMVRDQALAASGLMVERIGGPSVKPYQPDGLWRDLAGLEYDQDHGSDLYRRSLYTYWKRTVAPPAMTTFDAAGRETCIVKETRTNTPLQALNLMNDVTYVEAARVLGERMMIEADAPIERIDYAFQRVLGRSLRPQEQAVLVDGYERHLSYYRAHRSDAEALTKLGEFPRSRLLDISDLAACTTIAGLILNLDETITRE